tara:strand:+ start:544 stop:885 length:342 start_codon:yes stop_codon:yes gene_type:complete
MDRKVTLLQEEQLSEVFKWGYGFSIYRGVLVVWDEDWDKRILRVVDNIPPYERDELVAIQESKAWISFLWQDSPPRDYYNHGVWEIKTPCGDIFQSIGSYTVSSLDGYIEQVG